MDYITVTQYSEMKGISDRQVRNQCRDGKIKGAIKRGKTWLIPKESSDGAFFHDISQLDGILEQVDKEIFGCFDLYFKGRLEEALEKANDILQSSKNEYTIGLCYHLLYSVNMCLGNVEEVEKSRNGIISHLQGDDVNTRIVKLAFSEDMLNDDEMHTLLIESEYPTFMYELLTYLACKKLIEEHLATGKEVNVSYIELICKGFEYANNDLIAELLHLVLAIYFNWKSKEKYHKFHISKAYEIAEKTGWFLPFAMFSLTLNYDFIKKRNIESYRLIQSLSKTVIQGYINVGIIPPIFKVAHFTRLEIQICIHLADGKSNSEISQILDISTHTVKNYLTTIYEKTGCKNRKELISQIRSSINL